LRAVIEQERNDLAYGVIRALLWLAAFCFAAGLFLAATLLLRGVPPTPHVAVGRVTVENASKLRDYLTVLLFFLITPAATIPLFRIGARENERLRKSVDGDGIRNLVSLLFVAPFFLAPFLYLTTFKPAWPVLIPVAISQLLPHAVITWQRRMWVRRLFVKEMEAFHALIAVEALAWILFRYIAVGKRIAHIPTLFLELAFIAFFIALFWLAFLLVARIAAFTFDLTTEAALQRIAIAALPLAILPPLAILFVPGSTAIVIAGAMMLIALPLMLRKRDPIDGRAVRNLIAFAILPFLLFCISYASTASLTQWIDLFHRGESLGPASDLLRGKVPFRDVFALHGLLEDGLLDTWLMQLFGRDVNVVLLRPVVLGSVAVSMLWYLGMVIFDSIPLAMLSILLGAVTTVDNERALLEILAIALLIGALRRNSRWLALFSGVAAGVTIFYSLDIGLYSVGGGVLAIIAIRSIQRRWTFLATFLAGITIGATPFLIYLGVRGALGAFFETSFVAIPRIIDAIWSLPFPDMTATFRSNLNLHTLADFFLFEHFRFILNPLVIGIALVVLVQRAVTRRSDALDVSLAVLTAFAILTQRSALGRADFPHQYFSAFLIGPMILILLVLLGRATTHVWQTRDRAEQAFVILAASIVLPMLAVMLWVPDIANLRLDDMTHYLGRVSRIGWVDPAAEEIRHRVEGVKAAVDELSKPGAPIFDFSNQPALYFFCERPNPTRFYQVPILSPREYQAETILALERAKPPLVIRHSPQDFDVFDGIDNSIRAQAVAAYIDDHYTYARSTRGVEIWRRREDAPPLNLAGYLARIRIPTLEELGTIGERSRVVFPSAGSLPGANGAYWRSDLTIHNPLKERMALGLRYVSGDVRIDRAVTILGGQSLRWEDVVRSLFRAPEGSGVLWIEYRGKNAPVALLKTYDSARGAQGSIDTPLSMRDSATAGSDNADLTIVGIPGGTQRRVNLGVVNVGKIPATFRITVRTRTGQQIGKTFEEGLNEDATRVIADIDKTLGVARVESTAGHVPMTAGTGVAYVSVVNAMGDSQFLAAVAR
ncbi:MAG: hypothetical protein QOE82_2299, partial [Thermoanaerobaculia bacterium]|nr:hypothetical protein [Thermoanaerobaculia bacterium]